MGEAHPRERRPEGPGARTSTWSHARGGGGVQVIAVNLPLQHDQRPWLDGSGLDHAPDIVVKTSGADWYRHIITAGGTTRDGAAVGLRRAHAPVPREGRSAGNGRPGVDRVLVTGGTGFVGSHSVARLVREGYRVRVTVREPGQEIEVPAARRQAETDPAGRLEFAVADLGADRGRADRGGADRGGRYRPRVSPCVAVPAPSAHVGGRRRPARP
ncbi:NAD-dependent epimerase/dehydratase family protein [Streptomyces griseoloalbus]|uniref:NAD-dependent epimerase/dehydratase family protein n=1 Tax=Streptomyces griseoloalbus TaxID=67303 RepID=UPI00296FB42F